MEQSRNIGPFVSPRSLLAFSTTLFAVLMLFSCEPNTHTLSKQAKQQKEPGKALSIPTTPIATRHRFHPKGHRLGNLDLVDTLGRNRRSSHPTAQGYRTLDQVYDIHHVILLVGATTNDKERTSAEEVSKAKQQTNIQFHRFPLTTHAPSREVYEAIFALRSAGHCDIHCEHGADRTGALVMRLELQRQLGIHYDEALKLSHPRVQEVMQKLFADYLLHNPKVWNGKHFSKRIVGNQELLLRVLYGAKWKQHSWEEAAAHYLERVNSTNTSF